MLLVVHQEDKKYIIDFIIFQCIQQKYDADHSAPQPNCCQKQVKE